MAQDGAIKWFADPFGKAPVSHPSGAAAGPPASRRPRPARPAAWPLLPAAGRATNPARPR